MKTKMLFFALVVCLTSCEKVKNIELFDKKEKKCATVSSENLPRELVNNFNQKYKGASEINWFDKDGKSYVAVFTFNGKETTSTFERGGNFVKEEVDGDDEENDDDNDKGCSCDNEEEDKD